MLVPKTSANPVLRREHSWYNYFFSNTSARFIIYGNMPEILEANPHDKIKTTNPSNFQNLYPKINTPIPKTHKKIITNKVIIEIILFSRPIICSRRTR